VIPQIPPEFASPSWALAGLDDEEATTEVLLLTRGRITSAVERRFLGLIGEADR
jgi:hypothetical protein